MAADYTQMDHEELAAAADPLNRIVNRDYPILGRHPDDAEVEAAEAELIQLNDAARALNLTDPLHAGAMGPEAGRLAVEEVAWIIAHRLEQRDA